MIARGCSVTTHAHAAREWHKQVTAWAEQGCLGKYAALARDPPIDAPDLLARRVKNDDPVLIIPLQESRDIEIAVRPKDQALWPMQCGTIVVAGIRTHKFV